MSSPGNDKRQAHYLLPKDLILWVKSQAVLEECWPAHVVEEAIELHRRRKAAERKPARSAS